MSLETFAGNLPRDSLEEEWDEQVTELVLLGMDASPGSSLVMVGTAHRAEYEGCRQVAGMVVAGKLSTYLESWPCLGRGLGIQLLTVPLNAGVVTSHLPSTSVEGSSYDSAPSLPLLQCSSWGFLA